MTTRADEELGPRIQELEARLADLLAERRALTKTVKRERRNEFNDYETLEFRDRPPELETIRENIEDHKERRERQSQLENAAQRISNGNLHAVHGQRQAERYDAEPVAVGVDELTDQRCRGSHSRAKKLVAALSISIVASSSRFLRRSSRSSRAVSVGAPAASPASTSACRTHLRNVSALMPNRAGIAFIAAHSVS